MGMRVELHQSIEVQYQRWHSTNVGVHTNFFTSAYTNVVTDYCTYMCHDMQYQRWY